MAFFVGLLGLMKLDNFDDAQKDAIEQALEVSDQTNLVIKTQSMAGLVIVATFIGFEGAVGFIAFIGKVSNPKYSTKQRRIFTLLVRKFIAYYYLFIAYYYLLEIYLSLVLIISSPALNVLCTGLCIMELTCFKDNLGSKLLTYSHFFVLARITINLNSQIGSDSGHS